MISASAQLRAFGGAGSRLGDPQDPGTVAQHPHHRFAHRAEQRAGVTGDPIAEPLQVVDHSDQCPAARGQGHRTLGDAEEVGAQDVHRGGDVGRRGAALDPVGEHRADLGGVPAQFAWWRGGKRNNAAGTQITSAISQPNSRSPSGPTGVQTGSTKVSKVARWPAAMISLSTPENVTATR